MTVTVAAVTRRRRGGSRTDTAGPHFQAFMGGYCRHTKGKRAGSPVKFEPWQRDTWDEAFRLDRYGRRHYNFSLFGRPRKNYKTTECAGLALYLGGPDGEPGPDVACGAGAKQQAGMVFDQARDFVGVNPELHSLYKPQSNVILVPSKLGVIRKVSSEGGLQMGLNLSGAVLDELHVFVTKKQQDLYSAIVTSTAIREEPFIGSITTAGDDLDTLLGRIWTRALQLPDVVRLGKFGELIVARDRDSGFLMIWYGAPDDADIENEALWRAVNPAGDVSIEYLRQQFTSPHVSEGEFRRYHLNQWFAALERWISDARWRLTRSAEKIPLGAPIYVAVDAAVEHDAAAVTWSHQRPDERTITRARVWSARPETAYDVFCPDGRIDLDELETFILDELARDYRIREVVYDKAYFEQNATHLAKRGLRVAPMEQGSNLDQQAAQTFYADVAEGKVLSAAGEEGDVLRRHVEAAAGVKTEKGWKLSKMKSARPIDAAKAATWSHSRAVLAPPAESVYQNKQLLVLGDDEEDDEE